MFVRQSLLAVVALFGMSVMNQAEAGAPPQRSSNYKKPTTYVNKYTPNKQTYVNRYTPPKQTYVNRYTPPKQTYVNRYTPHKPVTHVNRYTPAHKPHYAPKVYQPVYQPQRIVPKYVPVYPRTYWKPSCPTVIVKKCDPCETCPPVTCPTPAPCEEEVVEVEEPVAPPCGGN